jgi:hypothetical protein
VGVLRQGAAWAAGHGWRLEREDGTALEGLETILDAFGADGWELVTIVPTPRGGQPALLYMFKHPMA